MADYSTFEQRFTAAGLDLSQPADGGEQTPIKQMGGAAARYPILKNVRQVQRGGIRPRPALNALSTAPAGKTPWHSTRRLSDRPTSQYTLVSGIGTELFTSPAAAYGAAPGNPVSRDTAYSGKPLTLVPFRPDQDIADWMAVFDEARNRKVRLDGTVHHLGAAPPTAPPIAELNWAAAPSRIDIETAEADGWSGGPLTAVRYSQVLNGYYYNGIDPTLGLVGAWFSLDMASVANVGPGTVLLDGLGRSCLVEEVHPPSPAGVACTISQIIYDTGASGWATIYPSTAFREFQQHAIAKFVGAGTQYAAIVDTFDGPDGTKAIRVYLPALGTAAGDTISVMPTLYAYCAMPPTSPLASTAIRRGVPGGATTSYKLGGLTLNLSSYSSGRSVNRTEDEMHISVRIDTPSFVDKLKIQLDVDDGTFTKNYYEREMRQADLVPLQLGTESAIDTRTVTTRRDLLDGRRRFDVAGRRNFDLATDLPQGIDGDGGSNTPFGGDEVGSNPTIDPGGSSGSQGATGANQWAELRFKLSDLQRYGVDDSKSLQNVVAIQLTFTTNTGGGTDAYWDAWWLGGGYEPDIGNGAPYEYRYRYRSSATGARSNFSPPCRTGVAPHRYSVDVILQGLGTAPLRAEYDKIDIQRRGGTVNDWVTIATTANANAGPITWIDAYSDDYALGASADPMALEGNTNSQPFPISDASFTVSAAKIAGPMIQHGSSGFNALWAHGTPVIANGIATSIRQMISADIMEVYDNVGGGANVRVDIPEPVITAQPLPVAFGPVEGWYFACGDARNPGRLYAFNRNTLDSTRGTYYTDITDPGDPLQNGCAFQGRGYVWSSNAMFVLAVDESLPGAPVRWDRIESSVGLFGRYALCVGDLMYWLGRDGIYASDGGAARNVTTATLSGIFPTRGVEGAATNGVPAPALTAANAHLFALSYTYDRTLWFDYIDGSNTRHSLGLMKAAGGEETWGWWYDVYANGGRMHYSDEGEGVRQILVGGTAATSKLFVMGASSNGDDGTPIVCQVRTFAFDNEYPRATKLYGDVVIDADAATATLTPTLYFDNFSSSIAASTITGSGRTQTTRDLNVGAGKYARNIAIDIAWTVAAAEAPILYRWGGGVIGRPDDTIQRATDYDDCGYWGPKELRGCDVECDTQGAVKAVVFEYTKDDGSVGTVTANVNAPQKTIVPVAFATPVIGYEIRLRPSDSNTWKEYRVAKWHFDPLADLTPLITAWDDLGRESYVHGLELFADSNGATVNLTIQKDFAATGATLSNIVHSGRGWKSYSFSSPFLAYLLRIVPSGPIRLLKWRWLTNPEAPLGDVWETQEMELGSPFGVAQSFEIEYASTTALTLAYTVDNTTVLTDTTTLAATGGVDPAVWMRARVVLPAAKGRLGKLRLSSASPFRIREKGSTLCAKQWGGGGAFAAVPFVGAAHRETGAPV